MPTKGWGLHSEIYQRVLGRKGRNAKHFRTITGVLYSLLLSHISDPDGICMTTLNHSMSSDEDPQHDYCSNG